jgi:hypothetical protein
MQATVRPDGTIYKVGFHSGKVEKGVRPVLLIKREDAQLLIKNNLQGEL